MCSYMHHIFYTPHSFIICSIFSIIVGYVCVSDVFPALQAPCQGEVESLSGYESYAGYESCDIEEEEGRGEGGGEGEGEEGEKGEERGEGMDIHVWWYGQQKERCGVFI